MDVMSEPGFWETGQGCIARQPSGLPIMVARAGRTIRNQV
jgi:hypothetical protein